MYSLYCIPYLVYCIVYTIHYIFFNSIIVHFIFSDLGPHLTNLGAIRTHLEKQSLDESVSVDPLIQSTKAFQSLRSTHFADIQVYYYSI